MYKIANPVDIDNFMKLGFHRTLLALAVDFALHNPYRTTAVDTRHVFTRCVEGSSSSRPY